MPEITSPVGRGSDTPTFFWKTLSGNRGEVVLATLREYAIQSREHIGRGFVTASGGVSRMIGEEDAGVLA